MAARPFDAHGGCVQFTNPYPWLVIISFSVRVCISRNSRFIYAKGRQITFLHVADPVRDHVTGLLQKPKTKTTEQRF